MIPFPELCRAPESCKQVSCDNTGGVQFSQSNIVGSGVTSPACLTVRGVIPTCWDFECDPLEKGREELVLQVLLPRAESLTNVWGDALDKIPLLLEGLMHTRICCLWMSERHPFQ